MEGVSIATEVVSLLIEAVIVEMNGIADIAIVDSLPRTPSDKVQKQLLRANWTCPTS